MTEATKGVISALVSNGPMCWNSSARLPQSRICTSSGVPRSSQV